MPAQGFTTSYAQPFTLEEAILLDVNTLVQEVFRLRNSIAHLQKTQDELRSYLLEDPEDEDGEITLAIDENEVTIASQTERIELLRVALTNKVGEDGLKHYGSGLGFDDEESGSVPTTARNPSAAADSNTSTSASLDASGNGDGGRVAEASEEGLHL